MSEKFRGKMKFSTIRLKFLGYCDFTNFFQEINDFYFLAEKYLNNIHCKINKEEVIWSDDYGEYIEIYRECIEIYRECIEISVVERIGEKRIWCIDINIKGTTKAVLLRDEMRKLIKTLYKAECKIENIKLGEDIADLKCITMQFKGVGTIHSLLECDKLIKSQDLEMRIKRDDWEDLLKPYFRKEHISCADDEIGDITFGVETEGCEYCKVYGKPTKKELENENFIEKERTWTIDIKTYTAKKAREIARKLAELIHRLYNVPYSITGEYEVIKELMDEWKGEQ